MKTVLITGASSGIGKATSKLFSEKGWNVAATMRKPMEEKELINFKNIKLYQLDVTDQDSIKTAIKKVIEDFGNIDAIINNAGYAAIGPFEYAGSDTIRKQFEINVFGLMAVTHEIIPYFIEKKSGTIVNIASVAGHIALPSFSLYNSTKYAIEGFSGSLYFELKPHNIRVKIVEPGPVKTDFYGRSMDNYYKNNDNQNYKIVENAIKKMDKMGVKGIKPERVAKTIYKAATSKSNKINYPVGLKADIMIRGSRLLPKRWLNGMINMIMS
ncbi:MAG: SDR family oxidoreductase [Bacteroidota bacterium]